MTSYSVFDGLNREIAHFGVVAQVEGVEQRPVSRTVHDHQSNVIETTNPNGSTSAKQYNAMGW